MKQFGKLTNDDAIDLGCGNRDGFNDYVMGLHPRFDETDTHKGAAYLRGYNSGYRTASRGDRPFLMKLRR